MICQSTMIRGTHALGLVLALLVTQGLLANRVLAKGQGPGTKVVRAANETISGLLKKNVAPGSAEEAALAAKVTDSVRELLNIDALGKSSLSKHWEALAPKQRQEFLSLLRKLIEARYVEGLRANLEYDVKYLGEIEQSGGMRLVKTEIIAMRRGRPHSIAVDYQLTRNGKAWQAFDVITDGVGLIENYRAQFNSIIKKKGFEGLLELMRKRQNKAK